MEDLSHLTGDIGTALVGGSSMGEGNDISRPIPTPIAGGPGSQPLNPTPPGAELNNPGVDVGAQTDYVHKAGN